MWFLQRRVARTSGLAGQDGTSWRKVTDPVCHFPALGLVLDW